MATSGLFPAHKLPSIDLARRLGIKDPIDFQALSNQFDCLRNFERVGIIYDDGYSRWLVRPSRRYASITDNVVTHVVITKVRETEVYQSEKAIFDTLRSPEFANELGSTALACGGAALTWVAIIAGMSVIPMTGGTSGVVAIAVKAGTAATVAQCINGAYRLYNVYKDNNMNAWLDNQGWYKTTSTLLDITSLASASIGVKKSVEIYQTMKKASSKSPQEWLHSLSRHERKRVTEDLIRHYNPGISNSGIKAIIAAGVYPKRFPSDAIQRSLKNELVNALSWSTAFAGSALSGTIRNPGDLKKAGTYAVSYIQSFSGV